MINKNINGEDITFTTTLSEATLPQIAKYNALIVDDTIDNLDKAIKVLAIFGNTTEDTIECLDIDDLLSIYTTISTHETDLNESLADMVYTVNDRTFRVTSKNFSVKEISMIKKAIAKDTFEYIIDLAAILYKEDGKDNHYLEEVLNEKKLLFRSMTYDYIVYHLLNLNQAFEKLA